MSSHLSFEVRRDEDVYSQTEEREHEDGAGEIEVQERREEPGKEKEGERGVVASTSPYLERTGEGINRPLSHHFFGPQRGHFIFLIGFDLGFFANTTSWLHCKAATLRSSLLHWRYDDGIFSFFAQHYTVSVHVTFWGLA